LAINIEVHLHEKFLFYEFGSDCGAYLLKFQKYFYFPI